MKIAMVVSSLSRTGAGVSAVVELLSRHVADLGVQVAVLGLEDKAWSEGDGARWQGAPAFALPVFGPKKLGYSPQFTPRLIEWAPDAVHVHGIWMHPSRSVLQWARTTRKPYIVSPHGMLEPWAVKNSYLKKRTVRWLYEDAHLGGASYLHALCAPEADAIRAFGLDNPICVIPNGVEMPAIDGKAVPPPPWQGRLPEGSSVMLFLGRLHPKKNLKRFLSAWARARVNAAALPRWHLVISGWDQNGHEQELRRLCATLGLETLVWFAGPLYGAEKDAAFRSAHAFVLPSLSEGLPMVVLEAWSYGLPVLMTDACNLPEGFTAGAAKRLSLDDDGMAVSLKAFLGSDATDLHRMAQNARLLRPSFE